MCRCVSTQMMVSMCGVLGAKVKVADWGAWHGGDGREKWEARGFLNLGRGGGVGGGW
jgi:hypothetical protein